MKKVNVPVSQKECHQTRLLIMLLQDQTPQAYSCWVMIVVGQDRARERGWVACWLRKSIVQLFQDEWRKLCNMHIYDANQAIALWCHRKCWLCLYVTHETKSNNNNNNTWKIYSRIFIFKHLRDPNFNQVVCII